MRNSSLPINISSSVSSQLSPQIHLYWTLLFVDHENNDDDVIIAEAVSAFKDQT